VYLMGVYFTGAHLMGMYLINVHLTGVHLIGVYLLHSASSFWVPLGTSVFVFPWCNATNDQFKAQRVNHLTGAP
jgi:hypothetical protein